MTHSPASGMVDADVGIDQHNSRRGRVLNNTELRKLWEAASTMGVYGSLVRILMLTGQRLNDWARAERGELSDGLLTVPPERYKVKTTHEVPLTPRVVDILEALPQFEDCAYLFSIDGRHAFSNFYNEKRRLDKRSGVKDWTHHDLRRTMRTRLSGLKVLPEVAERVIGHTIGGVRAHYDYALYREPKRAALIVWESNCCASSNPRQPTEETSSRSSPRGQRERPQAQVLHQHHTREAVREHRTNLQASLRTRRQPDTRLRHVAVGAAGQTVAARVVRLGC